VKLAEVKKLAAYVAGLGAEAVTLGFVHGTAAQVVTGVIAFLTGLGIYQAKNAPGDDGRHTEGS
jgi:hypothetical protein